MRAVQSSWIWIGLCGVRMLTLGSGIDASMIDEARLQLQQGVEVIRTNGSRFQGRFNGQMLGGFVLLREVGSDGAVEVDIRWQEVATILLPGESLFAEAIELLDGVERELGMQVLWEFYQQRSPFFPILSEGQLEPFLRLAEQTEAADPTRALGILRSLQPRLQESSLQRRVACVQLRCYLTLELFREAEQLARQQIASARDPGDASLAWIALSLSFLAQDEAEEAWRCAVHPLLFERDPESPSLRDAYLLAAVTSLRLRRLEAASRYVAESAARGLTPESRPYLTCWLELWHATDWQHLCASETTEPVWVPDPEQAAPRADPHSHPVPVVPLPLNFDATPPPGD